MFPKKWGPDGNRRPFQNLNISFRVPSKGTLPPGRPYGVPSDSRVPSKGALPPGSLHTAALEREMPHLQSPFQPSVKVPSRRAHSRLSSWAPMKRDVRLQSLPFIIQGPLQRNPPSRTPSVSLFREGRSFPTTASFSVVSKNAA